MSSEQYVLRNARPGDSFGALLHHDKGKSNDMPEKHVTKQLGERLQSKKSDEPSDSIHFFLWSIAGRKMPVCVAKARMTIQLLVSHHSI
jgi:hypothetical protein